ncbi:MAG: type II secretion system F family protein, partial [Candidatus Zixiibacteriota bacterium]
TAIRHVGDMIASGHTLSEAMAAYPRLFDPVFLGALRTGEATGRLDTVLEQTADFIEREMVTRRMIKATLRYPILVIVAMIVASVVILGFVVPKFMAFYTQYGGQLPLPTRVLLAVARLVESFWWVLPPLALGGWYFWWRWTRTEKGRQRRDEWALRIPLLGHLFLKVAVSRFARLFGVLFSAGVPAATALETVAQAVGNSVVAGEVDAMRERLSTGESISDRPGNAVMPNLVYQMLGIGFESGDVERMLGEVARHFDQEVEYDIRRLKDNIEPIILLILAVGVLTLALAVLMPMWNLISLFQQ